LVPADNFDHGSDWPLELRNREELIRWFLKDQDINVLSVELQSVEKIRLDDKDIPR
jgi:hypothetical protein